MRARKYIPGEVLTVEEAVRRILAGCYIFERNKPQHPGWTMGWPLACLRSYCANGIIREALINPDYKEPDQ